MSSKSGQQTTYRYVPLAITYGTFYRKQSKIIQQTCQYLPRKQSLKLCNSEEHFHFTWQIKRPLASTVLPGGRGDAAPHLTQHFWIGTWCTETPTDRPGFRQPTVAEEPEHLRRSSSAGEAGDVSRFIVMLS